MFKKFCPKTFLVKNKKELLEFLKKITSENKVIKPVSEGAGKGVFIGNDKYLIKCHYKFPLLVQEFMDTSDGIPGVYKGIHDLRIVFINDKLAYCFYRTPPKGELIANVAQGGKQILIPNNKIPKNAIVIAKAVVKYMKKDYVISVDIGFVKGEPYIIELNSSVGLNYDEKEKAYTSFKKKLAKILVK